MEQTELGRFIRATRERKKLTLRQLAELSGVSFSMIGKIERGVTEFPSQAVLESLARALMVPYERLDRLARGVECGEALDALDVGPESAELLKMIKSLPPEIVDLLRIIKSLPSEERTPYLRTILDQLELLQRVTRSSGDQVASNGN